MGPEGSDDRTTVGVVIRALNESALIGTCLEVLRAQVGAFEVDVLVVDSGSTDATVEIARSHGARVLELPPADFDYSSTLNLGIEEVDGDLVVVLSAHAIPIGCDWLARTTRWFDDPRVAGVASRQVPWPDAPWMEVHRLGEQFGETTCTSADGHDVVFSNAASVIRRAAWHEHRFLLPAAEDADWAERVVSEGWTIVYEAGVAVHHSHRESPRAQALRMIDINRVLDRDRTRRTRARTVREAAGLVVRDTRTILALDGTTTGRKLSHIADVLRLAWYYVVDFSRTGSTAERRGAGSAS